MVQDVVEIMPFLTRTSLFQEIKLVPATGLMEPQRATDNRLIRSTVDFPTETTMSWDNALAFRYALTIPLLRLRRGLLAQSRFRRGEASHRLCCPLSSSRTQGMEQLRNSA
jgi:hypothetical protein